MSFGRRETLRRDRVGRAGLIAYPKFADVGLDATHQDQNQKDDDDEA